MLGDILLQESSFEELLESDERDIHQQLQKEMETWNGIARQKLAASRDARKRAEADAQLLANRLRLLRAEEVKALRIIEEVRKRTREVLETRMKNQQMLQDQTVFKQNMKKAVEQKKQDNNWRRTQARLARQQAADERVRANRRSASEQRADQENRQAVLWCQLERSPSLSSSTAASEKPSEAQVAKVFAQQVPRPKEAELLCEERDLLARLRRSDACARARRPPLPPVALEDEGPIREALRDAAPFTPRRKVNGAIGILADKVSLENEHAE